MEPGSTAPIVFGIYSHGDSHPAQPGEEAAEWFAHLPYRSPRGDIYDFVATEGAKEAGKGRNRPEHDLSFT